jgi:SNF2 family DNA or RNA helicase
MKLFKHQSDALERTKHLNRVAYYHDMGLGKTYTGSEKLHQLRATKNVVVCQKSKVNDWLEHFEHNYSYNVFNLTKAKNLEPFLNSTNCVGVINYDLVFRRNELKQLNDFTLLLDESSMIQNMKTKRTTFILNMRPKNVILLSGTPVGGKYENLLSQCHLLGWNITKTKYWDHFINWELVQFAPHTPKIPIVRGYKNIDLLKNTLRSYGADFLKTDEVFDLPSQTFNNVYCDLDNNYKIFKEHNYLDLNGVEYVGDNPLKKLLYLRQLCNNENKLKAFTDLINSSNDCFIVFYNFNCELEQLKKVIGDRPYAEVNGQIKDLTNYHKYNNCIVFVQYQAGAMGLNLQDNANKMIYYSLPLSSELYEQSKKRIHRIKQNKPCFYYVLLCKKSIEEKILNVLNTKNDYTNELFIKDLEHEKM